MKKVRFPSWSRDELILALDLYLSSGWLDDGHPKVQALSKLLRNLPQNRKWSGTPSFRSPNSVSMKIANFQALDPAYHGRGLVGVSKSDQWVWDDYHRNPRIVAQMAKEIRRGTRTESLPLTMHDKRTKVPGTSGLNWGQRGERNRNEACITIPTEVDRAGFFPKRNISFEVKTDDGCTFRLKRTGDRGKNLQGEEHLAPLGEYFRRRLGVPSGARVTLHHLQRYGRYDVTFTRKGNRYELDFRSQTKFARLRATDLKATSIRSLSRFGQGYLADAKKKKLIEKEAMRIARKELVARNFKKIVDTSANKSYDFTATLRGRTHYVEVKGTQGDISTVELTGKEVRNANQEHPNTVLIVVPHIRIKGEDAQQERAEIFFLTPWKIDPSALTPTKYRYTVPRKPTRRTKRMRAR